MGIGATLTTPLSVRVVQIPHTSFPNGRQPTQITSYAKDGKGGILCPAPLSSLRRFRNPKIGSDLNEGIESFVPKDEVGRSSLDAVLDAVEKARANTGIHFCSFRNNLNKVNMHSRVAASDAVRKVQKQL